MDVAVINGAKEQVADSPQPNGKAELIEPRHERRDLALLDRAIRKGWLIPDTADSEAPEAVTALLASSNPMVVLKAAHILDLMKRTNLAIAEADKPKQPKQGAVSLTQINIGSGEANSMTAEQQKTIADANRIMQSHAAPPV